MGYIEIVKSIKMFVILTISITICNSCSPPESPTETTGLIGKWVNDYPYLFVNAIGKTDTVSDTFLFRSDHTYLVSERSTVTDLENKSWAVHNEFRGIWKLENSILDIMDTMKYYLPFNYFTDVRYENGLCVEYSSKEWICFRKIE